MDPSQEAEAAATLVTTFMNRNQFRIPRQAWGILIFFLAFFPRALYPVSRTALWYQRSIRFFDAVLSGNWIETFQRYHPGVTTMWLVGPTLKLFAQVRGLTTAQLLELNSGLPGIIPEAFQAGIIPIALAISLSIVLAFFLLQRLFNFKLALIAGLLLAMDPLYLTYSKVIHVDALLSTFMLIAALFLLLYFKEGNNRHLILSGIFGGLSLLSKTSAFFLIPYSILVLAGKGYLSLSTESNLLKRINGRFIRDWVMQFAAWFGVVCLLFFILFPAMWVDPLQLLQMMTQHVNYQATTAHFNATYMWGELTTDDPGILYYLTAVWWRTTAFSFVMLIISSIILLTQLLKKKVDFLLLLLFVYAAAFIVQMSIASREEIRYILPAFVMINVIAAYGATAVWDYFRERPWIKTKYPAAPTALLAILLIGQAIPTFRAHPYYGTQFNHLFGGARVGQNFLVLQDQGEGLDLAAQYLNTLPNAENASVAMHPLAEEYFAREFVGNVNDGAPIADYRVFYLNQRMRLVGGEIWDYMWDIEQGSDPLWTAEFDGITYVWIYGSPPQ